MYEIVKLLNPWFEKKQNNRRIKFLSTKKIELEL
jgi:hypothetical protein